MDEFKPKSFWKRPEGKTGAIVIAGLAAAIGFLVLPNIASILAGIMGSVLSIAVTLLVLGAIIYMVLDPKMRNLVW